MNWLAKLLAAVLTKKALIKVFIYIGDYATSKWVTPDELDDKLWATLREYLQKLD